MNKIFNQIQKLCSPAKLYFVISVLSFLGMLLQNCNSTSVYQVGTFKADTPCHPMWFFIAKAMYITFWTFGLNFLCQHGFKTVSWALVLLPIIGMFIIIGLLLFVLMKVEGFREGMDDEEVDNMETMDNKPKLPSDAPKIPNQRDVFEGFESCPDGEDWDEGAQMCMPNGTSGFATRIKEIMKEGFKEGNYNAVCGEGEQWSENEQKCVAISGFDNKEGFELGGDNWPQVGSLM